MDFAGMACCFGQHAICVSKKNKPYQSKKPPAGITPAGSFDFNW